MTCRQLVTSSPRLAFDTLLRSGAWPVLLLSLSANQGSGVALTGFIDSMPGQGVPWWAAMARPYHGCCQVWLTKLSPALQESPRALSQASWKYTQLHHEAMIVT